MTDSEILKVMVGRRFILFFIGLAREHALEDIGGVVTLRVGGLPSQAAT